MLTTVPVAFPLPARAASARDATGGSPTLPPARIAPAPPVMARLAGVWNGTLYHADAAGGTPFSLLQEDTVDGAVVGRLAFTGTRMRVADVQLLEASATTYVALVGPYYDPAADAQMVTVLEGRTAGDRLYGTYRVQPVTGGRATEGRFVAMKSQRAA